MRDTIVEKAGLRLEKLGASCEFRVQHVRRTPRGLVLALEGLTNRNDAETWAGAGVFAAREVLSGQADTYFDFELVGLEATDRTGNTLGTVTEVLATGANDVIVIASELGELLVPAVPSALVEIDPSSGRIVIDERTIVRDEKESSR
jgi:16S rRNA processing protein RimM